MRLALICLLLSASVALAKNLEITIIDVEGGKAVLLVSPSGESMLIDAGWPAMRDRPSSTGVIVDTAKAAGVRRIDHLVITHYDIDHIGDVPELASRIPIGHVYDHGDYLSTNQEAIARFAAYRAFRDKAGHTVLKPGDRIPIRGIGVEVLTAGGALTNRDGQPNPICGKYAQADRIASDREDDQSIGLLISFGNFRMLDLADLEAHDSHDLVCPKNRISTVDVYNVNVHGQFKGIAPALVQSILAPVMIQANGSKKGADAKTWPVLTGTPGLKDIWQLHFSLNAAREQNPPQHYIANMDGPDDAHNRIRISVNQENGTYVIENTRDGFAKQYQPGSH